MDTGTLVDVLRQAMLAGGVLLAPALVAALLVGIVMSLLQAITQVQDQAISFVPKLVVVGIVVVALMPWMTEYFAEYARTAIQQIPENVMGG